MAGVRWRLLPDHPVARDEERPVEAAAVVGHEPGVRRDERGEQVQQGPFLRVIRAAATVPAGIAVPPTSPRPIRNATVPAAEPRPVVSVSRHTSGTSACGWPGNRASASRSMATGRDAVSTRTTVPTSVWTTSPSRSAASRCASPPCVDGPARPIGRGRPRPRYPPEVREPAREERRLCHGGSGRHDGAPARRAARAGAARGASGRIPAPGAVPCRPGSPPRTRRRDQLCRRNHELVVPRHSRSDSPTPPGIASYR